MGLKSDRFRSGHIIIAAVLAGMCVMLSVAFAYSSTKVQTAIRPMQELVGQTAPEFNLINVSGGSMNSDELKGKVVVVYLWATWCGPCVEELLNVTALYDEYKDANVQVIGIVVESPFPDIR